MAYLRNNTVNLLNLTLRDFRARAGWRWRVLCGLPIAGRRVCFFCARCTCAYSRGPIPHPSVAAGSCKNMGSEAACHFGNDRLRTAISIAGGNPRHRSQVACALHATAETLQANGSPGGNCLNPTYAFSHLHAGTFLFPSDQPFEARAIRLPASTAPLGKNLWLPVRLFP